MNWLKKTLILAACLFALPVAAQATTWYFNRVAIPAGEVKEVPLTSGSPFTVVLKVPKVTTNVKIPCEVSGTEAFWNTPEGGRDETRSIAFVCTGVTGCPEPAITTYLPWGSTLLESTTLPLMDKWEGMALELSCAPGLFTGHMEAKVGDVDPVGEVEKEGMGDLDNLLVWRGSATNALAAPNGDKVWLVGGFKLGTKEAGITDEAVDS